jgi:heme A synthase
LALATFCLLIAGGLVSTTESGLACPDWPLCEGQYIPRMVNGKQFEHTHRLIASFVATMTFGLCALLFKHRRKDRVLTRLGVLASALVVVQALLGALTVKLRLPAWVSSTHQATAMAFFALSVTLAFLTRQRLPFSARSKPALPVQVSGPDRTRLGRGVLAVTGLTYLQIVSGAVMRHVRGGLACGFDFPLCLGQIWPLHGHFGIQSHMIHRLGGLIVGVASLGLAVCLGRTREKKMKVLAAVLVLGVLAQIALGILTILSFRDLSLMTLHSSLGAALLALLVSTYWLLLPSRPPEGLVLPAAASAKNLEPA